MNNDLLYYIISCGKAILVSVISTTAVAFSLTLYTFWAAKRGHDFSILGRFLFEALLVLILFALILVQFPLDKLSHVIYGCLVAIIFYGHIFVDTDNLNKKFSNDEYILASVFLYQNIIPFYFCILLIFTHIFSSTKEKLVNGMGLSEKLHKKL
ncbi:protein LIFEGUARD 4 [Medicago truncatula]|uniref:protein LIFEGUARD 4 n=1 Tax=Medicago truncatula TaxID=3880 RepID=UPI001967444A|nr:protein LIFEGUARD 4 [Medicago truncatula]